MIICLFLFLDVSRTNAAWHPGTLNISSYVFTEVFDGNTGQTEVFSRRCSISSQLWIEQFIFFSTSAFRFTWDSPETIWFMWKISWHPGREVESWRAETMLLYSTNKDHPGQVGRDQERRHFSKLKVSVHGVSRWCPWWTFSANDLFHDSMLKSEKHVHGCKVLLFWCLSRIPHGISQSWLGPNLINGYWHAHEIPSRSVLHVSNAEKLLFPL